MSIHCLQVVEHTQRNLHNKYDWAETNTYTFEIPPQELKLLHDILGTRNHREGYTITYKSYQALQKLYKNFPTLDIRNQAKMFYAKPITEHVAIHETQHGTTTEFLLSIGRKTTHKKQILKHRPTLSFNPGSSAEYYLDGENGKQLIHQLESVASDTTGTKAFQPQPPYTLKANEVKRILAFLNLHGYYNGNLIALDI